MSLGTSKRRGLVLLAGLALVAGAGCGRHGKEAPKGGSEVPPSQMNLARKVELAQAVRRPLTTYVETVGYLEAEFKTPLKPGVAGLIDGIYFREGQWVKKGTVLATVEQKRFQAAVNLARANLKTAEASVTLAKANVKSAEAGVALARDRQERAESAGVGSSKEERASARIGVDKAEADLLSARSAVSKAEGEQLSARASLELAERDLELSRVRAPYDGQVNQRLVTVGSYVGTGSDEKNTIATMADLSRIRLVGYIPEKAAPILIEMMNRRRRDPSAPAYLEFELVAYPGLKFQGNIFYLSTTASPDTHMYECKADVDAAGLKGVVLKDGYTATVKCPLRGNPNACVLPEVAVRASERGFIAFRPVPSMDRKTGKQEVDRGGRPVWKAERLELRLGYRSPGWVEVTSPNVKPGDWVVSKGAETLEDGTLLDVPAEQLAEMRKGQ